MAGPPWPPEGGTGRSVGPVLGGLVLAFGLIVSAGPMLTVASSDDRVLSVYHWDEESHLRMVRSALERGRPDYDFDAYGHLQFNLVWLPLMAKKLLIAPPTDQEIILGLRLVAFLHGLGSVWLTYLLGAFLFSPAVGWVAAALFAFKPLCVFEWITISHPDFLAVFYILLSLALACRYFVDRSPWAFVGSAAAAGLAFAAKYTGLMVLAILGLAAACDELGPSGAPEPEAPDFRPVFRRAGQVLGGLGILLGLSLLASAPGVGLAGVVAGLLIGRTCGRLVSRMPRHPPPLVCLFWKGMVAFLVFVIAFALTSPGSMVAFRFIRGIVVESRLAATGTSFDFAGSGLDWLRILASRDGLGTGLLALASLGTGLVALGVRASGPRQCLAQRLLAGWALFFVGFLILRVNNKTAHYLLPALPFWCLLAGWGLTSLADRMLQGAGVEGSADRGMALVLAVSLPWIVIGIRDRAPLRAQRLAFEQEDPYMRAGHWLAASYPTSTRVLYDARCYVPPEFADAHQAQGEAWGGTVNQLRRISPDIVVTNDLHWDRYLDPDLRAIYVWGPELFDLCHAFYSGLRDGSLGYRLHKDFGKIRVYERDRGEPVEPAGSADGKGPRP